MNSEEELIKTSLRLIKPYLKDVNGKSTRLIRIHGTMNSIKNILADEYYSINQVTEELASLRVVEKAEINIQSEIDPIYLYAKRTKKTIVLFDGQVLAGTFNIIETQSSLLEIGYSIETVSKTNSMKKLKEEIESKPLNISESNLEQIIEEGAREEGTVDFNNILLSPEYFKAIQESKENIPNLIKSYLQEQYDIRNRNMINQYYTLGEEVNNLKIRINKKTQQLSKYLIDNIYAESLEVISQFTFTFKKANGQPYDDKGEFADYVAEIYDNETNEEIGFIFYTTIINPFSQVENNQYKWFYDPFTAAEDIQLKLNNKKRLIKTKLFEQNYIWYVKINEKYLNHIL